MYNPPIMVLESFMNDIMEQREDKTVAIVQSKIDVDVDKDELIRALQYDRNQYNAGYKDGKADAMRWIPVSERVPQKGETAIALGSRGGVYVAQYKGSTYWHKLNARCHMCEPTYWMPIPKLPEVAE